MLFLPYANNEYADIHCNRNTAGLILKVTKLRGSILWQFTGI